MNRHKFPTIAERGGLEVYLTELGINYILFRTLRTSLGDKQPGAIAKLLTDDANLDKPIVPSRVRRWFRIDDQEEGKKHAKDN